MSEPGNPAPTAAPDSQTAPATPARRAVPPPSSDPGKGLTRLVLELVRPYRGWLLIVFIAMLIETAMSIAAPWPLKIIIDIVDVLVKFTFGDAESLHLFVGPGRHGVPDGSFHRHQLRGV